MKSYAVEFLRTEKSIHGVDVEAESEQEAIEKAKDLVYADEAGDTYISFSDETNTDFVAIEQ